MLHVVLLTPAIFGGLLTLCKMCAPMVTRMVWLHRRSRDFRNPTVRPYGRHARRNTRWSPRKVVVWLQALLKVSINYSRTQQHQIQQTFFFQYCYNCYMRWGQPTNYGREGFNWRSTSQLTRPKVRKQKVESAQLLISKWERNIFFLHKIGKFCFISNKLICSDADTRLSLICINYFIPLVGRDGSVSIATRYGLGVSGIESQWRRDFPHMSRPTLGAHPASCTTGTGSFTGVKRPGRGVDHSPHLAPRLKKK